MVYSKRKKVLPIFLCFLLLLITADHLSYRDRIYPGVHMKSAGLGGLRESRFEETAGSLELTFTGPGGLAASVPLQELGIFVDSGAVFSSGYRQGRRRPWPISYIERIRLKREGAFIPLYFELDRSLLREGLESMAQFFNSEPKDARFEILENSRVQPVPEQNGYVVDPEMLKERVLCCLYSQNTPLQVNVPIREEVPPDITLSLLQEKGIQGLVSTFTTRFNPEAANRSHNIRLAASVINNHFLLPGEALSLNRTLGDTTAVKGYREAPIMSGGELVPGVGGGVCQISSTLYNAALLANLKILERHNHPFAVPYMDPGRDATVSYPAKDLIFANNREHTLLITASVLHDELTFRIFGALPEERVEITSNILSTTEPWEKYEVDHELAPGEEKVIEGTPGYLVEVWKTVYRGTEVLEERKISVDRYAPYPTIIRRGP